MNVKKWFPLGVLSFFSIACSLILVEGILRYIHYPNQNCYKTEKVFEDSFDPVVGWKYSPYQTYNSFGASYAITSEGYRADSQAKKTDFSKPIILLIGDSFFFGHGLNFEDTFGYKLQKSLNDQYEVLNFSVQGFGTAQMYLLSQQLINKYHPYAVISDYILDHNLRNVNQDRRDILPCIIYPGTNPLFRLVRRKPVEIAKPEPYQAYDHFRILLALSKVFQGDLKKRAEREGPALSEALLTTMDHEIEAKDIKFYVVVYDNFPFVSYAQKDLSQKVLGVSTQDSDPYKYHIHIDAVHPNALANDVLTAAFLEKYKADFPVTK